MRRAIALLSLTLVACGIDVPLGSDDGGTCGPASVGGFGLDKTFGVCGTVVVDVAGLDNVSIGTQAIAVDASGRAVVGVRAGSSGFRRLALLRLTEDGGRDSTFGTDGLADVGVVTNDQPESVRVQPDGKVLIAGTTDTIFGEPFGIVGRVLENGALDTTFGFQNDGYQKLGNMTLAGSTCRGLVLRADGSMVCTGSAYRAWPGPGDVRAVALDAAGQLSGGDAVVDLAGADDLGAAGLELPDGKLVVPGRSGGDFAVVRLEANLTPDATFSDARGLAGRVAVDLGGGDDECFAALAPGDGTLWCAGFATVGGSRVGAVVRLTASGALDATFGTGGKVTLPEWRTVYALHRLAEGRVLLAGDAPGAGGLAQAFQVLDATGAPSSALVTFDLSTGDDSARALALDGRGRLFVFGVTNDGPQDDLVVHRFVDVAPLRLGVAGECSTTSGLGPLVALGLLWLGRSLRARAGTRRRCSA